MKKRLYISDLDGTLLNNEKKITAYSRETLNNLISRGVQISIATARTSATVEKMLKGINIEIPVVLMNGVALYDLKQHEYIDVEYIDKGSSEEIIRRLESAHQGGFIYTIEDKDQLTAYYNKSLNSYETIFYEERKKAKLFKNTKVEKLKDIIYFVFMDEKEKIEEIAELIRDIPAIDYSLYKDNYMEGAYLLEVYSKKASKSNGVLKVKQQYDYKEVVCFGDNLNDLSMFHIAEYSYAVGNAVDVLKEVATEVIDSNEEDGVVSFIKKLES
ncbi:Cof-type HAD-IIB family hydrolase [Cellulosilyticum ruminicola]|uniref:Cof-type HAD-IIB family hydrolase n=1 Tax=Cellulosilyticum ruminicola TaxID=425254 RepID=UPI0006D08C60|nr:Cof-type HAD-IIB family hydrolase [Cellulosilyticum ruminicola]